MEVLRPTLAASRVCRETSDATFREGDDTGGGAGGYADATIRTVGARARGEGRAALLYTDRGEVVLLYGV